MANDNKNKGWGNGPQESDTAAGSRKGWGTGPQESDTAAGPRKGWGNGPQESDTGARGASSSKRGDVPVYSFYILDGISFRVCRVISDQSGEAVIFEVENEGVHYALKLYRPGVIPNHDVLQRIMDNRGSGLLVDIYAHGVWHDDIGNGDYHYEVMEYCTGGSLASVNVHGDEARLRELATRMASEIDFAHSKGVLHRDVKPANFIYVDKEQMRFVLSDWGLAKTLDAQGRAETDDGRTKIYAAPEMYTYIPGTPTYVGPKADFFSMGMALMALWMGEGHLLADETKLVHDKQEETLPYPRRGEMSDHTLGLIKALTRRNPEVRAGFDDIVRWAKGESIFKDTDDSLNEFKIVFNATEGQIAHNPRELSDMMWADKNLAIKYLYSDKIAKWFQDIDRPELAMAMENITEKHFPGNQLDGLYAACLTLNPDMDFYFNDGRTEIAVPTLKAVVQAFAGGRLNKAHLPQIESKTFKMWLAVKDAALSGKTMQAPSVWAALYAIMPDRGYDFQPFDQSSLVTPEQLGQQIADEVAGASPSLGLADNLDKNFAQSRLYGYLWSKGKYDKQISWIKYCLEFDSKDNKKKFVPYTHRIASFKVATGLMGKTPELKIGSSVFRTLEDVENADTDALTPDQQDIIADWSTLFFQEAPGLDTSRKSFLRYTSEYTDFLDNLPECTASLRCLDEASDMLDATERFNGAWRKISLWRWFAALFCFLPLLAVTVAGIVITVTTGTPDFAASLEKVGSVIGIAVGGFVFLCMFGDDDGFFISGGAGILCFFVIKLAFKFVGIIVPWLIIGALITVLIFMCKPIFFGEKKEIVDNDSSLDWDELVDRYFIGAHFDCFDKVYPSSLSSTHALDLLDESADKAKTALRTVRRNALIMFVMALIGGGLCWAVVRSVGSSDVNISNLSDTKLEGLFSGDVEGTPSTVTFSAGEDGAITADMNIAYRAGATVQTLTATSTNMFPIMFVKGDNSGVYLRIDTVYTEDAITKVRGIYCNSKKNLRTVNLKNK